ncbi:hypothetical protein CcaCcLH18_12277 [Colletotrichum camelliae]|nr:hypothetical protein CcaCcLH18_12277 [Colletotrichum camelliae]
MSAPTISIADVGDLPTPLKNMINAAIHADDKDLFDIWVQLCQTIAFLAPSADRFKPRTAEVMRTITGAAEVIVKLQEMPDEIVFVEQE